MEALIEAILGAKRIVVFTGAGISTDSGIPDYRGTGGQYSAYQPVYYQDFLARANKRRQYWQHKASVWPAMRAARPGTGHRLVVSLLESRRLTGVITQNVDGLHEKSGIPPERIVNLHGTNLEVECIQCDRRVPAGEVLDDLAALLAGSPPGGIHGVTGDAAGGEPGGSGITDLNRSVRLPTDDEVPLCPACGGFLKPATVMFGQNLRTRDLDRAQEMLDSCDLLLAIGSTLQVQPAASIPVMARRNGARLAIVTRGETPLDSIADYRVDGDIGAFAEAALASLGV